MDTTPGQPGRLILAVDPTADSATIIRAHRGHDGIVILDDPPGRGPTSVELLDQCRDWYQTAANHPGRTAH